MNFLVLGSAHRTLANFWPVVEHLLGGRAMAAVMAGGACLLVAALALSWVPDEKPAA